MPLVIRQLHRDHVNLAKLLDMLDAELKTFDEGGSPDYDIMLDIMDYALNYPALCHHPKEDLVFKRLAEREPGVEELVNDLLAEHERLAQVTEDFAHALTNIVLDSEVSRAALSSRARHFVDLNRRHMEREEEEILPRAEAVLTHADWEEIDRAISSPDPLFGGHVQERYLALHQRIVSTPAGP